jgi:hypothetical protein
MRPAFAEEAWEKPGPEQAAEKGLVHGSTREEFPEGQKPALIMLHLRRG